MTIVEKNELSSRQYFENNKYILLTDVISKDTCKKLTEHMFELEKQGKTQKDPQCPLSDSVYGDPVLDGILENLAKPLGTMLGVELLPTYTYARIYRNGEVLERHTDRPACEISGTLTLGYDSNSELWPINVSLDPDDKYGISIGIPVGSILMYRGNEVTHWRPAYRGNWQTQVFFHYVDANGPHKDWKYDKREKLGILKVGPPKPIETIQNTTQKNHIDSFVDNMLSGEKVTTIASETADIVEKHSKEHTGINLPLLPIYGGVMTRTPEFEVPGQISFNSKFHPELAFTPEECKKIIEISKRKYPQQARVGGDGVGKVDIEVRRVEEYGIDINDETRWIYDKLVAGVIRANHEYFRFDLMGIVHSILLLHYKDVDKSYYNWHVDVGNGESSTRKLSVVAMLSDRQDYEGGDLIVNNYGHDVPAHMEQGAINMFPSYLLHTVTPVTKGERWVMVSWVHGSSRFR